MPLRNPILAPFFHSPAPPTGRPHQARRHKSVPTPVPTPNLASFRKTRPAIRRATGAGNEKVHNQSHFTFSLPTNPGTTAQSCTTELGSFRKAPLASVAEPALGWPQADIAATPPRNPILASFSHFPTRPTDRSLQARRHNLASFRRTHLSFRRTNTPRNQKVHERSHFISPLSLNPRKPAQPCTTKLGSFRKTCL